MHRSSDGAIPGSAFSAVIAGGGVNYLVIRGDKIVKQMKISNGSAILSSVSARTV
jgi:hypothetical protein